MTPLELWRAWKADHASVLLPYPNVSRPVHDAMRRFVLREREIDELISSSRAEAFEEAAKYLDSIHHKSTAELIRNLAKEGK
jgi:hypothetical protein